MYVLGMWDIIVYERRRECEAGYHLAEQYVVRHVTQFAATNIVAILIAKWKKAHNALCGISCIDVEYG